MKKFLTFVLVCCLVFSSSSTVFATATQWDTSDQANLRYIATSVTSGGSLYTLVNNIYSRLGTISNNITDIKSYLFDSNHGIAYWVHAINTWMSPIYTAIQNTPNELNSIKRLLGYVSYEGETEVIDPYLAYQTKGVGQYLYDLYTLDNVNGFEGQAGGTSVTVLTPAPGGSYSSANINFSRNGWRTSIATMLLYINNNIARAFRYQNDIAYSSYGSNQTAVNWLDLSNKTFTPNSSTNGLYQWLSNIQAPVARLSYVLASDERIEAQEKAADNEQTVVDNFIDSSGSGAASTSDFSSISDLSSGFKNNIATDASVSGIWNIFNADNFGWFSQETADQLDTSGSGNRTLRSSGSYPTPLLDKQTEDIMKILGGEDND